MTTMIALPARVDLPASIKLREQILATSNNVTFDASEVHMLTTPALQVLLAAKPHVEAGKRSVKINAPSPEFLACLADFGIELATLETEGAVQ